MTLIRSPKTFWVSLSFSLLAFTPHFIITLELLNDKKSYPGLFEIFTSDFLGLLLWYGGSAACAIAIAALFIPLRSENNKPLKFVGILLLMIVFAIAYWFIYGITGFSLGWSRADL